MTTDAGVDYNYVRPLATIEPTALRVGLPVKTSLGFRQVHILAQELLQPSYETATIFIAEHYFAQQSAASDRVARQRCNADFDATIALFGRRAGFTWRQAAVRPL